MPLKAPAVYPGDIRSFDQWTRQVAVTPDAASVGTIELKDGQVTYDKIQSVAPVSVLGNLHSSAQAAGEISFAADNQFLVRRSGLLTSDVIADADIPASIARDTEVTAAFVAFVASSDPLTQYLNQTRGDARYVQLANVLNASGTYDPPSLADGVGVTTTLTVTGAALGDFALASFSLDLQGITVSAYVSVANTVSVRLQNESGSVIDLGSGTLRVRVWKQ
jgi:hypothetical protein